MMNPAKPIEFRFALDSAKTGETIFNVKSKADAQYIKDHWHEVLVIRPYVLTEYREHRDNKNRQRNYGWNKGFGWSPDDDTKEGEWRHYDGEGRRPSHCDREAVAKLLKTATTIVRRQKRV